MTDQEKEAIKQEILEQLKFDSLLIEDLTPALALDEDDKFELDGGRYIPFSRLVSEIRLESTLDKYRHVDRGEWKYGEIYYAGDLNPITGLMETSHVWYFGCKFRCLVTGTTEPPLWSSTDWEFEEGYPFLKLDWGDSDDWTYIDQPSLRLGVTASLYNQDVTHDPLISYDWTRQSIRSGVQDTASDNLWNENHKNAGNSMTLDGNDMNYQFGDPPEKLTYRVTATLNDPNKPGLLPQSADFEVL